MESKPNRIEITHMTEDGTVTDEDVLTFDTPEAARAEHDRMYAEDSAQELGVTGDTDLVWTYLYENGEYAGRHFWEFI
jgi:hypothetical protein